MHSWDWFWVNLQRKKERLQILKEWKKNKQTKNTQPKVDKKERKKGRKKERKKEKNIGEHVLEERKYEKTENERRKKIWTKNEKKKEANKKNEKINLIRKKERKKERKIGEHFVEERKCEPTEKERRKNIWTN